MTPREYEYFTRKDAECSAYRLRMSSSMETFAPRRETSQWPRAAETAVDSTRAVQPQASGVHLGTVLGIVALSVVGTVLYLMWALHDPGRIGW